MRNGVANQITISGLQDSCGQEDGIKTFSEARGVGGSNPSLGTNKLSAKQTKYTVCEQCEAPIEAGGIVDMCITCVRAADMYQSYVDGLQ